MREETRELQHNIHLTPTLPNKMDSEKILSEPLRKTAAVLWRPCPCVGCRFLFPLLWILIRPPGRREEAVVLAHAWRKEVDRVDGVEDLGSVVFDAVAASVEIAPEEGRTCWEGGVEGGGEREGKTERERQREKERERKREREREREKEKEKERERKRETERERERERER